MSNKIEYIKCPRCELNYINKQEKLCKVCEAELQAKGNRELSDEEIKELNLCPICRTNYLMEDEDICSECAAEKAALENSETLSISDDGSMDDKDDREDNWRAYVENDDAEVPEDEFGDMSSITTEDEDLEGDDLDMDEEQDEEFDEDLDEEFDEDLDEEFDEDFADEDFDEDEEDDEDDEDYDD